MQSQGLNRIVVQVPGLQDPGQLKALLGKTAKMTFHLVNEEVAEEDILRGTVPADLMAVITRSFPPLVERPKWVYIQLIPTPASGSR